MSPSNVQLNLLIPALSAAWRDAHAFIAKTNREAMAFFTGLALFPWLISPNWMYPLHFFVFHFPLSLLASGLLGLVVCRCLCLSCWLSLSTSRSLSVSHITNLWLPQRYLRLSWPGLQLQMKTEAWYLRIHDLDAGDGACADVLHASYILEPFLLFLLPCCFPGKMVW